MNAPLKDEERALLQAVVAAEPGDRAAHLVYADWLSQRGDRRGVLMAMQLRISADIERAPSLDKLRQQQSASRLLAEHACAALDENALVLGLDSPPEPSSPSPWLEELPARSGSFVDGFSRYPLLVTRHELSVDGDALLRISPQLVCCDGLDDEIVCALPSSTVFRADALLASGAPRALWVRRVVDDFDWTEELTARGIYNRALLEQLAIHRTLALRDVGFVDAIGAARRGPEIALLYDAPATLAPLTEAVGQPMTPMTPPRAAAIVADVAFAISRLHDASLVDEQLQPARILLAPDGGARVLGLSLPLAWHEDVTVAAPQRMKYAAPEQLRGDKEQDARSDVFTLGVILGELLCGAHPFVADGGLFETARAIIEGLALVLAARRDGLPAALLAIIDRALQRQPAARYASATELHQALRAYLDKAPTDNGR